MAAAFDQLEDRADQIFNGQVGPMARSYENRKRNISSACGRVGKDEWLRVMGCPQIWEIALSVATQARRQIHNLNPSASFFVPVSEHFRVPYVLVYIGRCYNQCIHQTGLLQFTIL